MEKAMRVKPAHWILDIGLPIVVLTIISATVYIILGEVTLRTILSGAFVAAALMHLLFTLRLHNIAYLIPLGFYSFAAIVFLVIPFKVVSLTIGSAVAALLFFVLFMRQISLRKLKWRYREVLELAARSVRTTHAGYTERPFPGNKLSVDMDQAAAFGRFLKKKAIAWPLVEKDKIILIVPDTLFPFLLGVKKDYQDATYVSIDNAGRTSVKIAKKDYRIYQDEFTFDKLCAALLVLFEEFLKHYQSGNESSITRRMDDLDFFV